MPVLVNYNKCNCAPTCFAANVCPNEALHVDKTALRVWVEPEKCGTCPAPCLNFCDAVALKYAPTMEELEVVRQELEGALTPEMAAELRNKMKEEMKAKEEAERKKKDEESIKPIVVTLNNFKQEVADAPVPVVIDFWAEWCGPCKQIAPIIDQLSKELAGKVKFVKVNVDEQQEIAYQFQIQSIPTLMIFYRKQPVDMIVGAVDKRSLTARLQRVLDAVAQLEEREKAAGGNVLTESESSAPPAPPTQPKTRPDIVTPQFNVRRTPRQRQ